MDIDKLILKFIERQKTQNNQRNIEGEDKVEGLTLLNFKIYCETIVIKTV